MCKVWTDKSVPRETVWHHSASIVKPNCHPQDRFVYPYLTLMTDSYNLKPQSVTPQSSSYICVSRRLCSSVAWHSCLRSPGSQHTTLTFSSTFLALLHTSLPVPGTRFRILCHHFHISLRVTKPTI